MKKFILKTVSALLIAASVMSCSKGKQTLHIYNWADLKKNITAQS